MVSGILDSDRAIEVNIQIIRAFVQLRHIGIEHAELRREVEADAMSNELCRGGRMEIRGLCAFKVKEYPGYTGRNPKTGEPVRVKGKKLPFFKVGTDLKQRVDR